MFPLLVCSPLYILFTESFYNNFYCNLIVSGELCHIILSWLPLLSVLLFNLHSILTRAWEEYIFPGYGVEVTFIFRNSSLLVFILIIYTFVNFLKCAWRLCHWGTWLEYFMVVNLLFSPLFYFDFMHIEITLLYTFMFRNSLSVGLIKSIHFIYGQLLSSLLRYNLFCLVLVEFFLLRSYLYVYI